MAIHSADAFNFVKSHLIILGIISYSEDSCLHSTFKCISCFVLLFLFLFLGLPLRSLSHLELLLFLQCERRLLNTLFFYLLLVLALWSSITRSELCGFISESSLLSHWFTYLIFLKVCFGLDTVGGW